MFVFQGLRFLHFPYLLTLQLKRFDFDYTTMHRIKLNDRMTFPEELDMSPFIDVEDEVKVNPLSCWGGRTLTNCFSDLIRFSLHRRSRRRPKAVLTAGQRMKAVATVTR